MRYNFTEMNKEAYFYPDFPFSFAYPTLSGYSGNTGVFSKLLEGIWFYLFITFLVRAYIVF